MNFLNSSPLKWEEVIFATPELKVLKVLLNECTTTFQQRVFASKIKNIRDVGGAEGLTLILKKFQSLSWVDFIDNNKSFRLVNDLPIIRQLKIQCSLCDLQDLSQSLQKVSTKGFLFGSRAQGTYRSDSDYDLFIVSNQPKEIAAICASTPLSRQIEAVVWSDSDYSQIEQKDPGLLKKINLGRQIWGNSW